jgi:deoxyribose-phosphate aldolase
MSIGGGAMHALPEVEAWQVALQRWAGDGPPPALPGLGVVRPGGPAPQRPWGPEAAAALADPARLAPYLDHTLLRPEATDEEVRQLAEEARALGVGGACVHPARMAALVAGLGGAPVEPVSVVGFPHGAHRTEVKLLEARLAIADGARAVDVVAPLGPLRAGAAGAVLDELRALVEAVAPVPLRVILETGLLPRAAVALGAGLALLAGCDAVKTSTGFSGPGARPEDVLLLRQCVAGELGVKASGGIRSAAQARALVAAGASRLGTSVAASVLGQR